MKRPLRKIVGVTGIALSWGIGSATLRATLALLAKPLKAAVLACCLAGLWDQLAMPEAAAAQINVPEMRSAPDGNYLVNLETDGKERVLNLKVKANYATCVNSSDPELKDLQGAFQQIGVGTFRLFLQNDRGYRTSQIWIFRKDGGAAIREVPDRGEMQKAVPVSDDSLKAPKRN